jgi:polyhydroxyalkanoate synthesis regulator phasin
MSTTPPPDRPTERLQPRPPPPQYERVAAPGAGDATLLFTRLEDTISSLRTALVVVGVLAALALGAALYAILRDDGSTGTRGAGSERVARLDDRVDRLSRQLQRLRSGSSSPGALSRRVDDLSRQVATLRDQGGGGASPETTQAIQDLGRRVDDLSRQVQDLGQGQTTPP